MKNLIKKYSKFIFFILPLSIFSLIGFLAFYFALRYPENLPIYGWITIIIFAIEPLIIIYGFVFGFSISEKQQRQIEQRQQIIFSDEKAITIEKPYLIRLVL